MDRLKTALAPLSEDAPWPAIKEALDSVVRSYGGDPKDSRQRLDALLAGKRYW